MVRLEFIASFGHYTNSITQTVELGQIRRPKKKAILMNDRRSWSAVAKYSS